MTTTHRHSEAPGFTCENCGRTMLFAPYCAACDTVYPERRGLDLFDRIGLPRTFFLDPDLLDRREVEISRQVHPDRFVGREGRADLAVSFQASLNEALRVLREPFARAEYLLSLAPEYASELRDSRALPDGFLAAQLELREELDGGASEARVQEIRRRARRDLQEVEARVGEHFRLMESGEGDPRALRAEVRLLLNQVKYFQNVQRAARGESDPRATP